MQEEELIFEEDEVIWAKIRGYPWWPAYVTPNIMKISELHTLENKEYEYTVVFFGDNTNSRVDETKVRKFIDNYIEFYLKAKSHRKLMTSIMMAEEKLKQNDQNVEIFQELRNKIKEKRPRGRPKESHESNSHLVESQGLKNSHRESQLQIFQQAESQDPKKEVNKGVKQKDNKKSESKVQQISTNKPIERMEVEQNIDERLMQQEEEQQSQKVNFPQKNRKVQHQQQNSGRKVSISREVDIVIDIKNMREEVHCRSEGDIVKDNEDKEKGEKVSAKRGRKKKSEKNNIKPSQEDLLEKDKDKPGLQRSKTEPLKDSEEANHHEKTLQKIFSTDQKNIKEGVRPQGRKRGRPPKKIEVVREPDSDEEFSEVVKPDPTPLPKKKMIKKSAVPLPALRQPQKEKGMSITDRAVVSGVQRLLQNRQGLIDFLSRSTITVDNVKQILDMDVSQILQEGTITDQVVHLLQLLRAALLYKYFPDDIKHRKKYEKLSKRKYIQPQQEQEEVELSRQKVEIRKKTCLKVKKFLSSEVENESQNDSIATKIEQEIFAADTWVGQKYCKIAFLVLTALKERKETSKEILEKLQNKGYG